MGLFSRGYPRSVVAKLAPLAFLAVSACSDGLDFDMRGPENGLDTTNAARGLTADRPAPDARGVISYPNYQVAVAQRGDRVADVAARVGVDALELARMNGIPSDVRLRRGELLALPSRVPDIAPTAPSQTGTAPGAIDITTLATAAIDRSGPATSTAPAPVVETGPEPVRHTVARGETAYSIARTYNVSVRALADWNGLGPNLSVREGQFLLIPVALPEPEPAPEPETPAPAPVETTTAPGQGSPTPEPPSASKPLPAENETQDESVETPASPNLAQEQTPEAQGARLLYPVTGKIIRAYAKNRNEGIDIAAAAGTPVRAADAGVVAAITQDTDQVPIIVIRHAGELLTVYANVDSITVEKGAQVSRGAPIAKIRAGNPAFLHFEVRQGFESVDPMPYLE